MFKSHSHNFSGINTSIGYFGTDYYGVYYAHDVTKTTVATGGSETRPKSITVRYWERVS